MLYKLFLACINRWYIPNYDLADPLAFGKNAGCRFLHGSCREHIELQETRYNVIIMKQFMHISHWLQKI